MLTFKDLMAEYNCVSLATPSDNQEILNLSEKVQMQTDSGGLKFDRNPDFFALSKIQGEKSFTFLFRNKDQSLVGYGCISITPMLIKGQKEYLGYTSDLRFSSQIEKETKIQFYKFYETIIKEFKNIDELKSCRYIIASILDGNAPAKKVMVQKKGQNKGHLIHRPFYSYSNINVVGTLPLKKLKNQVEQGSEQTQEEILDFLTHSQEQNLSWTREEILRRKKIHGFEWKDFLILRNQQQKILACCALLTDYNYRKAKVENLSLGIRVSQVVTSILGRPKVKEKVPLRIGYVSFLKIKETNPQKRAHILSQFLTAINEAEQVRPKHERFHSITVHEPADLKMGMRLLKQGHINIQLPATLYQVIHESDMNEQNLIPTLNLRPDFDVVFH